MKHTNYFKTFLCLGASVALMGCSATRYSRSTGQYIDDNATTARVKSAIRKDSLVEGASVVVTTYRGNVHLTGFVDHPIQKERAGQLARNVKGVEWFKNDILTKGDMPATQYISEGQINEPAGANRNSNAQGQNSSSASVSSGKFNGWERGSLLRYDPAAEFTSRSNDKLGNASASADIATEPAGSSSSLTQRINTQLRADNSSAVQNVRVETDSKGTVTLRGTVGSDQEKRSIENRVKGIQGVSRVNNELEIQE